MQKVSRKNILQLLHYIQFQLLFHSDFFQFFSPFLHSTFHYRLQKTYLIFVGWSFNLQTKFRTCFVLLKKNFYLKKSNKGIHTFFFFQIFYNNKKNLGKLFFFLEFPVFFLNLFFFFRFFLGLFYVRSPLLTESLLIFIPLVTKMVQFTRFCFLLSFLII